jgi:hypothetical protein
LVAISHCHEYVDVPVDGIVPVTTNVWSTSIAVALTVDTMGGVRARFTITTDAEEVCASGDVALSVTT